MRGIVASVVTALLFSACGASNPDTVTLLTHDFFAISDELSAEFTAATGYRLEILRGGDAGIVVNQAILSAGNPVADVIFGVDTTLLSRALEATLFEAYRSPELDAVPEDFRVAADEATPVDFGDVCLNYDKEAISNPPDALRDLTGPSFAGALVVPDPTISTPGLAFLLATVDTFGEVGEYTWRDFWAELRANDLQIVADWGTAYYSAFSANGGDRPIVVSYASSPPAEVLFADPSVTVASTAVITAGCFRQIEYAAILRGASNPPGAAALIDFLLSEAFQTSVPESMFVFPVRSGIELPQVFRDNTTVPARPTSFASEVIEANRDRWLAEWVETVLR